MADQPSQSQTDSDQAQPPVQQAGFVGDTGESLISTGVAGGLTYLADKKFNKGRGWEAIKTTGKQIGSTFGANGSTSNGKLTTAALKGLGRGGLGWKLHLNVGYLSDELPKAEAKVRDAKVAEVLKELGKQGLIDQYKSAAENYELDQEIRARGGRGFPWRFGNGKDITVYIGSRDDAKKVARILEERVGEHLLPQSGAVLETDGPVNGSKKVWGRFDIGSDAQKEINGDPRFKFYGREGVPVLKEAPDLDTLSPKEREAWLRRSYDVLKKDYGQVFTGRRGDVSNVRFLADEDVVIDDKGSNKPTTKPSANGGSVTAEQSVPKKGSWSVSADFDPDNPKEVARIEKALNELKSRGEISDFKLSGRSFYVYGDDPTKVGSVSREINRLTGFDNNGRPIAVDANGKVVPPSLGESAANGSDPKTAKPSSTGTSPDELDPRVKTSSRPVILQGSTKAKPQTGPIILNGSNGSAPHAGKTPEIEVVKGPYNPRSIDGPSKNGKLGSDDWYPKGKAAADLEAALDDEAKAKSKLSELKQDRRTAVKNLVGKAKTATLDKLDRQIANWQEKRAAAKNRIGAITVENPDIEIGRAPYEPKTSTGLTDTPEPGGHTKTSSRPVILEPSDPPKTKGKSWWPIGNNSAPEKPTIVPAPDPYRPKQTPGLSEASEPGSHTKARGARPVVLGETPSKPVSPADIEIAKGPYTPKSSPGLGDTPEPGNHPKTSSRPVILEPNDQSKAKGRSWWQIAKNSGPDIEIAKGPYTPKSSPGSAGASEVPNPTKTSSRPVILEPSNRPKTPAGADIETGKVPYTPKTEFNPTLNESVKNPPKSSSRPVILDPQTGKPTATTGGATTAASKGSGLSSALAKGAKVLKVGGKLAGAAGVVATVGDAGYHAVDKFGKGDITGGAAELTLVPSTLRGAKAAATFVFGDKSVFTAPDGKVYKHHDGKWGFTGETKANPDGYKLAGYDAKTKISTFISSDGSAVYVTDNGKKVKFDGPGEGAQLVNTDTDGTRLYKLPDGTYKSVSYGGISVKNNGFEDDVKGGVKVQTVVKPSQTFKAPGYNTQDWQFTGWENGRAQYVNKFNKSRTAWQEPGGEIKEITVQGIKSTNPNTGRSIITDALGKPVTSANPPPGEGWKFKGDSFSGPMYTKSTVNGSQTAIYRNGKWDYTTSNIRVENKVGVFTSRTDNTRKNVSVVQYTSGPNKGKYAVTQLGGDGSNPYKTGTRAEVEQWLKNRPVVAGPSKPGTSSTQSVTQVKTPVTTTVLSQAVYKNGSWVSTSGKPLTAAQRAAAESTWRAQHGNASGATVIINKMVKETIPVQTASSNARPPARNFGHWVDQGNGTWVRMSDKKFNGKYQQFETWRAPTVNTPAKTIERQVSTQAVNRGGVWYDSNGNRLSGSEAAQAQAVWDRTQRPNERSVVTINQKVKVTGGYATTTSTAGTPPATQPKSRTLPAQRGDDGTPATTTSSSTQTQVQPKPKPKWQQDNPSDVRKAGLDPKNIIAQRQAADDKKDIIFQTSQGKFIRYDSQTGKLSNAGQGKLVVDPAKSLPSNPSKREPGERPEHPGVPDRTEGRQEPAENPLQPKQPVSTQIRDDHWRDKPAGEGIGIEKSLSEVKSHGYKGQTANTYSFTDVKGRDNTLSFRPTGVVLQTKEDGTSFVVWDPAKNGGAHWPGFKNKSIADPYAGKDFRLVSPTLSTAAMNDLYFGGSTQPVSSTITPGSGDGGHNNPGVGGHPDGIEPANTVIQTTTPSGQPTPAWHANPGWSAVNDQSQIISSIQDIASARGAEVLESRPGQNGNTIYRLSDGTYQTYNVNTGMTNPSGTWDNSQWAASGYSGGSGEKSPEPTIVIQPEGSDEPSAEELEQGRLAAEAEQRRREEEAERQRQAALANSYFGDPSLDVEYLRQAEVERQRQAAARREAEELERRRLAENAAAAANASYYDDLLGYGYAAPQPAPAPTPPPPAPAPTPVYDDLSWMYGGYNPPAPTENVTVSGPTSGSESPPPNPVPEQHTPPAADPALGLDPSSAAYQHHYGGHFDLF